MIQFNMKLFVFLMGLLTASVALGQVSGIVFLDANKNGIHDNGEIGLTDILVSNGVDIISTSEEGRFVLERVGHLPVFLIKPRGYQITTNDLAQPLFYESAQTLKEGQLQFGLYTQDEKKELRIALLGDTQPHNIDEVYYTLRAIDELKPVNYDFSLVLGDVVSDNPVILPLSKKVIAAKGKASYFTFGNHDLSWDSLAVHGLDYWDRDWINVVGPTYYAMTWGTTNILNINNIHVKWNETKKKYDYDYLMKPAQLTFIKNYLSFIDKDDLLIISAHSRPNSINNNKAFYELFRGFSNVLFVFGHHHKTENYLIGKDEGWPNDQPAHCIGAGAICGGHWRGEEDMFGIPSATMVDGSPKGYVFLDIETNGGYTIMYKATGMPVEKQMHIYTPDHLTYDVNFKMQEAVPGNSFYANIYLGGDETMVEYRVDENEWRSMQKVEEPDPYLSRVMKRQKLGIYPTEGARKLKRDFDNMAVSSHLWKADCPSDVSYGVHQLEVRFTDPHIENSRQKRSFIHLSPFLKEVNKELDQKYKEWVDSQ